MDIPNKKAKIDVTKKVFQASWLDLPQFKAWLKPLEQRDKCYCRACNVIINCGKSELEKHSKTTKHISKIKAIAATSPLPFVKISDTHEQKVKNAEIKLASFFAEHNVATQCIDHLVPLLKSAFPDSKIVSDINLGRTKCTKMIKNVIAKVASINLVNRIQENYFSVLVDESTDICNGKKMCCLLRYVDPSNFSVKTELLELINVNASDCSGEALFKSFMDCLMKHKVPLSNLTGMACDNASVMLGIHNSFYSRLKALVPNLVLFKCICHSSALIASHASHVLPKECEDLLRDVGTYMSESPKSCAILQEFQSYFNVQIKKILSPSKTRWLTLQPCVVRLLENWNVLQYLFLCDSTEAKRRKACHIYEKLTDPKIKSYFYLMKYVLVFFNHFNALFQSDRVLIHIVYSESKKFLLKLAQNFIKFNFLEDIEEINNINDIPNEHFLNINEVYVGPECEECIKSLDQNEKLEFKLTCQEFYKASVQEIIKRLPLKDPLAKELEFLCPKIALDMSKRVNCKTIDIIPGLISCNKMDLAIEWRQLPVSFAENEKCRLVKLNVEEFWKEVGSLRDFEDSVMFPNLIKVAKFALSLPHSNAESERIFSVVTDVKTKNRNRLDANTLNSLCVIRSAFSVENITCMTFQPQKAHIEFCNKKDLYV